MALDKGLWLDAGIPAVQCQTSPISAARSLSVVEQILAARGLVLSVGWTDASVELSVVGHLDEALRLLSGPRP